MDDNTHWTEHLDALDNMLTYREKLRNFDKIASVFDKAN